MDDDSMNYFAAPPAGSGGGYDLSGGVDYDAPVMGGEDEHGTAHDFAAAPLYVGDVNETAADGGGGFDESYLAMPSGSGSGGSGSFPGGEAVLVMGENEEVYEPPTATTFYSAPPLAEMETPPPPPPPSEPSAMQLWNAEWQETLLLRKEEENTRRAELIEAAARDLEQFQLDREQKREAKIAKNREDEQIKLEAIEVDLENDNSWQKVCKMVELSHDSAKQAADVKRMRDVLILLKNKPEQAVALS